MRTTTKLTLPLVLSIFSASQLQAEELKVITVTAQKTEQNINDVPITVTAFDGNDIADLGIIQAYDLAQHTPGLYIKPTVGDQNPVITIRGIGFNDFTSIQNPGAGVYVDQVIVPFHPMMTFQLLDLERIEVLKGPQGTLYGRNSTAGAINFISAKPEQEFSGKVRLNLSSWSTTDLEFAVGGGLSENLSARIAYNQYTRSDSYQKNRLHPEDNIGEKDRSAYRLSLKWDDESTFSALLNLHGGQDNSGQVALEHLGTVDPVSFAEPCRSVAAGNRAEGTCTSFYGYFDPDNDPHAGEYSVSNAGVDNDAFGLGLTMDWELSDTLTFTSVTGFDEFNRNQLQDIDAGPIVAIDVTFTDETESISQELRLTSRKDGVTWVGGIFYSDDSVNALQSIDITELVGGDINVERITADVTNNQDSKSTALFINANYDLNDTITLLTGIRYTDEQKKWDGGTLWLFGGVNNFSQATIDDTDVSGQLGLEYRPNDDWLIYGTVSKGFRSGGFPGGFSPLPENLQPFDAEKVFAYEAGFKATLLDGEFQLNAATYYYDWQDMQTQFSELRNGLIALFLTNAGDADISGLEVDFDWAVSDNLNLHGGFNLMNTEISSDDSRLDGKDLANAPDLTYNLLANYFITISKDYDLQFAAGISFTDERFFTTDNEPVFHGDDYLLTNARVSLLPANADWRLTLWGRNLGDEEYRTEGFNQFGFSGDSYHAYGEPSSYGVSFTYDF